MNITKLRLLIHLELANLDMSEMSFEIRKPVIDGKEAIFTEKDNIAVGNTLFNHRYIKLEKTKNSIKENKNAF